jgi:AcrR family transcriptional regulator
VSELPTIPQTGPTELPVVGGTPDVAGERADAARNRDRILCAAARLFEETDDPNLVTMDAVAAAAGVGKGTVFRRFGDRASLMRSLLNEEESSFQESVIRGDPPLGPGAPPTERLIAFSRARFELLERHGLMMAAAEASERGDARFDAPVYVFYRSHINMLVREANPACDADYLTEALLAPLSATQFVYQRRARGMSVERIAAAYEYLVRRLLG